jgi:dUTPase
MDLTKHQESGENKNPLISSITPLLTWCRIWANSTNRQETNQSLPRIWILEGVSCLGKSSFTNGEVLTNLRNNGLVQVRNLDYYDLVVKQGKGQGPSLGPLHYNFPLDGASLSMELDDQSASALAHIARKHLSPYWSNQYRTFLNNQLDEAIRDGLDKGSDYLIVFDRCGISDVLYNALFKYYDRADKKMLDGDRPSRFIYGIERAIVDATRSKEMASLTEFQLALRGYISLAIFLPRDHKVIEERMRKRGTVLDHNLLNTYPNYVQDQITMFQTFERMTKVMAREYQDECDTQRFPFRKPSIHIVELDNHEYVSHGITRFDQHHDKYLERLQLVMEDKIFGPITYAHEGDAGFDIEFEPFPLPALVNGHYLWEARLKLAVNWDRIPKNVYLQLVIRSSWAKKSLTVLGGVIDHGYNGPIFALIQNVGVGRVIVQPTDRVVQGIFKTYYQPPRCQFLTSGSRGQAGFGSTDQYRNGQ